MKYNLNFCFYQKFCGTKWSTLQSWYEEKLYPRADENRFRSVKVRYSAILKEIINYLRISKTTNPFSLIFRFQCFKAAWMTTVLHKGLKFPPSYHMLRSVQLINHREVQWTLGALLHRTRFLPLR